MEFEYKRWGTQTLICNFHVVTGEVVSPTVQGDARKWILSSTSNEPSSGHRTPAEVTEVFVTDQLHSHQSEGLVKLGAKACGIAEETLGTNGKSGVLTSLKSRKEFLAELSHRIRFVYTPKHCSWLNQVENLVQHPRQACPSPGQLYLQGRPASQDPEFH